MHQWPLWVGLDSVYILADSYHWKNMPWLKEGGKLRRLVDYGVCGLSRVPYNISTSQLSAQRYINAHKLAFSTLLSKCLS